MDVADELDAVGRGQRAGSMRGPQTTTMRSSGTPRARAGIGVDHALQEPAADARAADRDEADPLVGP